MVPERITLPVELLAGAHVIATRSTENCNVSLRKAYPLEPTEMGLTIFDLSDGRRVFVCSELAGNPGMSVTNAWPELASWLVENIGDTSQEKAAFVEHYWPGSYKSEMREETFDQVLIDWNKNSVGWRRLGVEKKSV